MGEFTIFGTTADAGIELSAESLEELFAVAVRGFVALLMENPCEVRPRENREVSVNGDDERELLVSLLNELVFLFDAGHWLPCRAEEVVISGKQLRASLNGEPFDPQRHRLSCEIKAATYHQALVIREGNRWRGRVIVDL